MAGMSFVGRVVYREKKRRRDRYLKRLHKQIGDFAALSPEEKQQAAVIWTKLDLPYNDGWFAFYKKIFGTFDARFVPQCLWNHLEISLNPILYREILQHKAFLYRYLPEEFLPDLIAYRVRGGLMGRDHLPISPSHLISLLDGAGIFIKKYCVGAGGGKGVSLVNFAAMNRMDRNTFVNDLLTDERDWLCQMVLKNGVEFSRLNPSSLNTIRIITLALNGRISVLSSFCRMASRDVFCDNACQGGYMVGVKPDGQLSSWGMNDLFEIQRKSPTAIPFADIVFDSYPAICHTVTELHRHISYMGFIAWDVTVDQEERIRIIELNLDSQEPECHQVFNGPLFGDRTAEVVDWVSAHPPKRLIIH